MRIKYFVRKWARWRHLCFQAVTKPAHVTTFFESVFLSGVSIYDTSGMSKDFSISACLWNIFNVVETPLQNEFKSKLSIDSKIMQKSIFNFLQWINVHFPTKKYFLHELFISLQILKILYCKIVFEKFNAFGSVFSYN